MRHGRHQLLQALAAAGQRHQPGRDEGRGAYCYCYYYCCYCYYLGAGGDVVDDPGLHARAETKGQGDD